MPRNLMKKSQAQTKTLGLQLHEHLRAHKGCSRETCIINQSLREAQKELDQQNSASRQPEPVAAP